ncbi:hypothetical protein ACKKBG_A20630 [Auxenochlorella protothecoides x Auxenochlorella symbiontica]
MLELQHVHGPVHGATDPRHGQSFVRHGCARPGHGRAHAMPRFANVWRRGASAPRYRALRQDTSAPGPKLEPFVVQNSAAQRAVTFQRQGTLACGAGLLVLPLPKDRLEDAATLLNDSFAESLGYISMYRSYLQSQIRQYLRQHLPLLPKTVILAAFRVGDEQGAELAVEGSGDAEGEEEHLDHEPECELVGIVELSFSASTRTKALTLNPPPEHAYLSNMAVSQTMRRQGIGSFLLSSAEELAQTMGHTHVYLHSRVDDAVGVRMYSRAGYETVSQDSGMVRLIGVDPRYLMSKPCGSRGALAELAAM